MSLPVHLTSFTIIVFFFFFNDTATTEIYTLSLHDALPISHVVAVGRHAVGDRAGAQLVRGERVDHAIDRKSTRLNSSHGYISYAVFCLKKKKTASTRLRSYTSRATSYWWTVWTRNATSCRP